MNTKNNIVRLILIAGLSVTLPLRAEDPATKPADPAANAPAPAPSNSPTVPNQQQRLGRVALNKIRQVSIIVENFDRAVDFYSKTLGLPLLGKFPNHTAVVRVGDTMLFLQNPEDAGTNHTSSTIYFDVDDIVAERKKLQRANIAFEEDIHQIGGTSAHGNLWMTFFHDPDGNYLALCSTLAPEIKVVSNEYSLISHEEGYKNAKEAAGKIFGLANAGTPAPSPATTAAPAK